jgi:NifB/MoaA-like Fe-S oxidoreductase
MTEVRLAGAGGVIVAVEPGSPAETAPIQPADRLVAINGQRLRDVIDYQFYSSAEKLTLDVERDGVVQKVSIEKDAGEPLGLEFDDPTFDRIRTCNNNCPFCFLKGLPKGMRRSLYIKDDDYRYSFLYGNFVTLTNLSEADWARVFEQQLSPLYVSVHATDPDVRRQLLGNPRAPAILPQIDALAEAGLQIHTQIVLCPGQNDGAHLEQTIRELSSRFPTVQSIGVVPVGLTPRQTDLLARNARQSTVIACPKDGNEPGDRSHAYELLALRTTTHCERVVPSAVRLYKPDEAIAVVAQVTQWQRALRKQFGKALVYAADEFYLMAGAPVPSSRWYDGYPQYENGIGMVRSLLDDWSRARGRLAGKAGPRPSRTAAIVCGQLPAGPLRPVVAEMNELGFDTTLVPIKNDFFGPTITVSGLLTGADVTANLASSHFDMVFLPRYMLDTAGARTLDGWTPDEMRAHLGSEVVFTSSPSAVARALARP